jgi:hypothetical protein
LNKKEICTGKKRLAVKNFFLKIIAFELELLPIKIVREQRSNRQ